MTGQHEPLWKSVDQKGRHNECTWSNDKVQMYVLAQVIMSLCHGASSVRPSVRPSVNFSHFELLLKKG